MSSPDLNSYFAQLDEAYENNDIKKINEINAILMQEIGVKVGETSLDFQLMENIKGKPVYRNLASLLRGKDFSVSEIAKILSSLVTHMIIECDQKGLSHDSYPIKSILKMVEEALYDESFDRSGVIEYLKGRYGKFLF